MSAIKVINATYIQGYKLCISFSDHSHKEVDFEPAIREIKVPQYEKYKTIANFKKFKIENGNVVWGKDWDLIFSVAELHNGKLKGYSTKPVSE